MHNLLSLPPQLLTLILLTTLPSAKSSRLLPSASQPRRTTSPENTPDLAQGWTPKPTSPPTWYPWLGHPSQAQLLIRHGPDPRHCGWLSGNPEMPLDCGKDVCAYYNNYEPKGFVCCPTTRSGTVGAGQCPYRKSCMHNGLSGNAHTGIGTRDRGGVLSCGIDEPFCYAIENSASAGGDTWVFFGCDTATGFWPAAMTTTRGDPPPRPTPPPGVAGENESLREGDEENRPPKVRDDMCPLAEWEYLLEVQAKVREERGGGS